MAQILVIDDDPDIRGLLSKALGESGHEVTSAANGHDAITQSGTVPAELVIMDMFMRDLDGVETIAEFRMRFPDARIIAISGNTLARPALAVAQQLGALATLEKPFTIEEMLQAVDKILRLELPGARKIPPGDPAGGQKAGRMGPDRPESGH